MNEVYRVEVNKSVPITDSGIPNGLLPGTKVLYPTRVFMRLTPSKNLSFKFYIYKDGFGDLRCMGAG